MGETQWLCSLALVFALMTLFMILIVTIRTIRHYSSLFVNCSSSDENVHCPCDVSDFKSN